MSSRGLERCWKVHGYPLGYKLNTWKRNNTGRTISSANFAKQDDANGNKEANIEIAQYQKLMQLMKQIRWILINYKKVKQLSIQPC